MEAMRGSGEVDLLGRLRRYRRWVTGNKSRTTHTIIVKGQTSRHSSESIWSPPPLDTRNPRSVSSVLPISWEGIGSNIISNGRGSGRWKGKKREWPPKLSLSGREGNG
ncbi:hypothetical protein EVAR_49329_1 [Eumeta japonica]|uniref:Uncharacterized protein n=1 Tax=Eumeta variegata TaxID=151549 RepID=A0A4C1Y873_EUMVA|nr:hypothetical protein EVAR_49329_1 [Eumeta japonica]